MSLLLLLLLPSSLRATNNIKIYVRSLDGKALAINVWNAYQTTSDSKWTDDNSVYGKDDEQLAKVQTETIGGNTWYYMTYDRDLVKAIDNTTYSDSYFNIQFRTQDGNWHSAQWGVKQGDLLNRLPDELFFTVDPNATTTVSTDNIPAAHSQSWTGIHETTREQAEGKNIVYYLMDANGNRLEPFYPVRNQNQGLHTYSNNSYEATVWAHNLTWSTDNTTKFYIEAFDVETTHTEGSSETTTTYTALPQYQYRPWKDGENTYYDITPDPDAEQAKDREWKNYDDCISRVSDTANKNLFQITKKELTMPDGTSKEYPASYTIILNTANIFNSQNDGSIGNQSIKSSDNSLLTNDATNNCYLGVRSIGIHPNKALSSIMTTDEKMYVISNMQQTYHDYWQNATVDADKSDWDLTTDREMTLVSSGDLAKLIKQDKRIGESGDVVYSAIVNKPGNSINSIFMAFARTTDLKALDALTSSSTDAEKSAAWNLVVRPFVAEGKDASALYGGLYRPVKVDNGNQALSPGLDDEYYSKCTVYINLTKGTYLVVPVSSYDLTGTAIQYFDPVHKEWENKSGNDEAYWGNGESSFWSTPMVYNEKENCWEYTGEFNHCVGFDESAAENDESAGYKGFLGFRFLTNHLYTNNYREDYDRPAATQSTTNGTVWSTNQGEDKTQHEDSYYYNHVDLDPDVNMDSNDSYASAAVIKSGSGANTEKMHNINFSLPSGKYTIKFYPEGRIVYNSDGTVDKDKSDPHPFYTLGKADDPGTDVPDNHDEDDITKAYKYVRSFSSTTTRKLSSDQKCFVVTAYSNKVATLTEIPYIPANTGVILAYTMKETDKFASSGRAREIANGIYDLEPYMVLDRMLPSDSATYAGDATLQATIAKNLLKPTSFAANGKITEGGFTVNTSDFVTENGKENTNKIAYRNYNFAFYMANGETNYKLGFYRIITGEVSPNRAYLHLKGSDSGGETPTPSFDDDISDAISGGGGSAKAQIFNAFTVEYPDWDNGGTTGIAQIVEPIESGDNYYYNLQGVKVLYPVVPGVYIHQGKKIIIR